MQSLYYDLNDKKVQYLITTDKSLAKLIRYIGSSVLVKEEDGFNVL